MYNESEIIGKSSNYQVIHDLIYSKREENLMLNEFYKQFKSGTDIRGVASEGVEGQSVNLTDEVVASMADGFMLWLAQKVGKKPCELKISVGRDSRIRTAHHGDCNLTLQARRRRGFVLRLGFDSVYVYDDC